MRTRTIPGTLPTAPSWTASVCIALLALASLGSAAFAGEAPTVEQIVERHLTATGGRDAALAIQSARATGVMKLESGAERPFTWWFERPSKFRIEVAMPGMMLIHVFDGRDGASAVLPAGSARLQRLPLGEAELEQMRDSADFDGPLFDFAHKGNKVELIGKSEVDGAVTYELKVTKPNGHARRLFLDAETFLVRRQVMSQSLPDGDVSVVSFFRDHRPVSGVLMAHTIEQHNEGTDMRAITSLGEIVTNVDIPDAFFTLADEPPVQPPG